jgi:hypothetical protein
MYKGTIIENSLSDKSILDEVKITKIYHIDDWTLYDVLITEDQIKNLRKYFNDEPWYAHFWKQDNDNIFVVFKDKLFIINYRDKNTWNEAIMYGKSMGIPEEQLDFLIS